MVIDSKNKKLEIHDSLVQNNKIIKRIKKIGVQNFISRYFSIKSLKNHYLNLYPDISELMDIATCLQYFAKYYLRPNNANSVIWSTYDEQSNTDNIFIQEDGLKVMFKIHQYSDNLDNTIISIDILNPDSIFHRKWNKDTIDKISKNEHEDILFIRASKLLMRYFTKALLEQI